MSHCIGKQTVSAPPIVYVPSRHISHPSTSVLDPSLAPI